MNPLPPPRPTDSPVSATTPIADDDERPGLLRSRRSRLVAAMLALAVVAAGSFVVTQLSTDRAAMAASVDGTRFVLAAEDDPENLDQSGAQPVDDIVSDLADFGDCVIDRLPNDLGRNNTALDDISDLSEIDVDTILDDYNDQIANIEQACGDLLPDADDLEAIDLSDFDISELNLDDLNLDDLLGDLNLDDVNLDDLNLDDLNLDDLNLDELDVPELESDDLPVIDVSEIDLDKVRDEIDAELDDLDVPDQLKDTVRDLADQLFSDD